jgi:hypothetical protein
MLVRRLFLAIPGTGGNLSAAAPPDDQLGAIVTVAGSSSSPPSIRGATPMAHSLNLL